MIELKISYRGLLVIALAILSAWLAIQLWPVILLFGVSLLFMVGFLPYVDALEARGLGRSLAVILILITVLVAIGGLFAIMVPPLVDQVASAQDELPASAREIEKLLDHAGVHVELQERARNINYNGLISGRAALSYGQRIISVTTSIVSIVVITTYLLLDTKRMRRFLMQFIPTTQQGDADQLLRSMSRVVGGYLRGQFITSACIGIYTFLLLTILGAPNPAAFGVLAAFADIIPLVGALIATVPPVIATLPTSWFTALLVFVGLEAYQMFEDWFLTPHVYGSTLDLPPLVVLLAILAGAELLGIVGVLLALPLIAAARVVLDFVMEKRGYSWPGNAENAAVDAGEEILAPDTPPVDNS